MLKTVRNLTVLGVGLSASAIVGWLLLRDKRRGQNGTTVTVKSHITESAIDSPIVLPREVLEDAESSIEPSTVGGGDDLVQIKDIGPRFAGALQAIGITRYAQLAEQTPDDLAARLAPHVTVTSQRIRERDWIGQAARLAKK